MQPAGVGLVDALPYVTVGTAMALLLALPHPLGWYGSGVGTTFDRLLTFELSLLLALLPLLRRNELRRQDPAPVLGVRRDPP